MIQGEGGRGAFKSKSTYSEASHPISRTSKLWQIFGENLFMKNWAILLSTLDFSELYK